MIKSIKMLGLAIVAVMALTAVAATGASAAAHFHSTLEKGEVKGHATTEQVFKTVGEVKCKKAEGRGTTTGFETISIVIIVEYRECTAFGSKVKEPIIAEYLFDAEGTVTVKKEITIEATELGCSVKVPASAANENLKTVTYKNLGTEAEKNRKIEMTSKVEKITWTGTGGLCGTSGTAGTYTGTSVSEEIGGEIWWTSV